MTRSIFSAPLLTGLFALPFACIEAAPAKAVPKPSPPTMTELLAASKPSDWRPLDPPIKSIRVAADLPATERIPLEIIRTDTPLFQSLIESRRNRSEPWFHLRAGRIELANVPTPIRRVGDQK